MKINIIGRGNVATHLHKAFMGKADVAIVNPHTFEGFNNDADITLISVSDNAISSVAKSMPATKGIIAHTSGSAPLNILSFRNEKTGVFYPLQTFTKGADLDYSEIPFFIEAADKDTEKQLTCLASLISSNIHIADSGKRKVLHVASVFACNFTNHLWNISDRLLTENGMCFDMIRPLLKETLKKTERLSPFESQTGPAVRQDSKTIDSHLSFLNSDKELANIYKTLSSSIISTHHK